MSSKPGPRPGFDYEECRRLYEAGESTPSLALRYGVSAKTISRVTYKMKTRHQFTEKEALESLQRWGHDNGRVPTRSEWIGEIPSSNTIRALLGSWAGALRAAGLIDDEEFSRRESVGRNSGGTGASGVPNSLFAQFLKNEMCSSRMEIGTLAARSGVSERTIGAILAGKRERCTLNVADRLVCALGRPDAWHLELVELEEAA